MTSDSQDRTAEAKFQLDKVLSTYATENEAYKASIRSAETINDQKSEVSNWATKIRMLAD